MSTSRSYRIAVVEWDNNDGMSRMIRYELRALGHEVFLVQNASTLPEDTDVVFSFGPCGKFLPIPYRVQAIPPQRRPVLLHWYSEVYAQLHTRHGLPTIFAPWGSTPEDYADLGLERDIDVLGMGKRATKRRSKHLDRIRGAFADCGVHMHVADNEENPFIFAEERMRFLNRAKITLNLTRTWYDDNFSRFSMAAPNRCLIVSEPLLSHCPSYQPGIHYVAAPIERLAETILYYLKKVWQARRSVAAHRNIGSRYGQLNSVQTTADNLGEPL